MKAICTNNGKFRGKIPDRETYCAVLNGERDWKPHIKAQMETVEIPYSLFVYLMELDRIAATIHVDGKEEAIDAMKQRLLDAFPESNRDNMCPAIYWEDFVELVESVAEELKDDGK